MIGYWNGGASGFKFSSCSQYPPEKSHFELYSNMAHSVYLVLFKTADQIFFNFLFAKNDLKPYF